MNNWMKLPEDFNWVAILKDLAHGAPLTNSEHDRLMAMALRWPTCACGQLCQSLPHTGSGAPLDRYLLIQGVYFASDINNRDWNRALITFHKIEARTAELLLNAQ